MKSLYLIISLLLIQTSFSQNISVRKKEFLLEKGLAINGYDPVAYFAKMPMLGKNDINYIFEGIKYQFATIANLNTFKTNPTKYEPQYGGWCAFAMGEKGEKIEIDPETYKIVDGKLYLFFHPFYKNTLSSWNKNEKELKIKADAHWAKFIKQ
jgi:YHS domain-containing protein